MMTHSAGVVTISLLQLLAPATCLDNGQGLTCGALWHKRCCCRTAPELCPLSSSAVLARAAAGARLPNSPEQRAVTSAFAQAAHGL